MPKLRNYLHMNAKNKSIALIAANYSIARLCDFWLQLDVSRVVLPCTIGVLHVLSPPFAGVTTNPDILTEPLTQPTFEQRDINANEGSVNMSEFFVGNLLYLRHRVLKKTPRSYIMDKHLFPPLVGCLDSNVDEGLSIMSGLQRTPTKPSARSGISRPDKLHHQRFFLAKDSCFFNQSLIASSIATVCVTSARAQAISNAILRSLGILPRTSLISSLIDPTLLSKLIFTQPPRQSSFALVVSCGVAALRLQFGFKCTGPNGNPGGKQQAWRSLSSLMRTSLSRLKNTFLLPSRSAPMPGSY